MDYGLSTMVLHLHSVLKLFTGFATAALIAWKLIVIKAMTIAASPANRNIHHEISILYAKFCSHLYIIHHAIGEATSNAIDTNHKNSRDNKANTEAMLAPNTFLIPISFVRCSAVNIARPSSPRQE